QSRAGLVEARLLCPAGAATCELALDAHGLRLAARFGAEARDDLAAIEALTRRFAQCLREPPG
ncbi:MAG: hypothetical protein AAFW69_08480, partial [Pseudomonadota bacterium]